MKLLLDTHIYLWWLEDSPALPASARKMIETAETVFISSASLWESAIKSGMGKLDVNQEELVSGIRESGFEELPVRSEHTVSLLRLDNHHKDPHSTGCSLHRPFQNRCTCLLQIQFLPVIPNLSLPYNRCYLVKS
jgi:PIN domain nuclease of toxin-antitoxin system